MQYVIVGFIVALVAAGFKIHSMGYDSGFAANKAEVLEVKNTELAQLNQDNIILQNQLERNRRNSQVRTGEIENEYLAKMAKIRAQSDRAADDLAAVYRMRLAEAEGRGKDENSDKRERIITFINGLEGTEGALLAPKTRYDLEQLSISGDEAIVLLGLCQDTLEADREPVINDN